MTNFPDVFEINVIDRKTEQPVEGIVLQIHLFASRKNDYYLYTSYSDAEGRVAVTRDNLYKEIDDCNKMFIMDYASGLQECKPYIEIITDGKAETEEKIRKIEQMMPKNCQSDTLFFEGLLKTLSLLKASRNRMSRFSKKTIPIEQGSKIQTIEFRI